MLDLVYSANHGFPSMLLACAVLLVSYWRGLNKAKAAPHHYRKLWLAVLLPGAVAGALVAVLNPLLASWGMVPGGLLQLFVGLSVLALAGYAGGLTVPDFWPGSEGVRSIKGVETIGFEDSRHPWKNRRREKGELIFASVPMSVEDETRHFMVAGTTGTGKTTAIRLLLDEALKRGDRAIVADPNGDFSQYFFNAARGDVLLNPFDERSPRWDLFSEIKNPHDSEVLAEALIPKIGSDQAEEWREYARVLLRAVFKRLMRFTGEAAQQGRTLEEVLRLVNSGSRDEMEELLEGTPAAALLTPDNSRMFASVRGVAGSAIGALEYIQAQKTPPFSVRQWVRGGRGVLFLNYTSEQIASLRLVIAAWMGLAITEGLSRAEGSSPLWYIVDELDTLGPVREMNSALTRLRKHGGRCVLGFQSISQVFKNYGAEGHAITENCGNALILKCSGGDSGGTAEFASKLIGERTVMKTSTSTSHDSGDGWKFWKHRTSTNRYEQQERAVLPSDIERIPDLHGYLKIASVDSWCMVRIDIDTAAPREKSASGKWSDMPWKWIAPGVTAGCVISGLVDLSWKEELLARNATLYPGKIAGESLAELQKEQAREAYLNTLPPAERYRAERESAEQKLALAKIQEREAQAARIKSLPPPAVLPQEKIDVALATDRYEKAGADEFALLCYGERGTALTDGEYEHLVSALSYEYRSTNNPLRKEELLKKLKGKYDARIHAFRNRYFVLERKVFVGDYDSASQSFPLRPDAAQVIPWELDDHWAWLGGETFDLKVLNMGDFENYPVGDRNTALRIADLSMSQRSGHAKIYLFARDVTPDGHVLTAEIVRIQLFDYSNRLIGEFGQVAPPVVKTASLAQ